MVSCKEVLEYTISDYSSYSGDFSPRHVLDDKPSDQKSRWLSEGTHSPQFLVLRLARPAIVHAIKFGKYERAHQCNVRKLQVYAGMDLEKMHLVLEGGLENNSEPEVLSLQHCIDGGPFPSAYIKIVPLQSWGTGFNYSIWHVQLIGVANPTAVQQANTSYAQYREREALRLCLKHLRQNDFTEAFEALQKKTKVALEHPLLTQLHTQLVVEGNWEESEEMVRKAIQDGHFDDFLEHQPLESVWSEVHPVSGRGQWPPMRGAHQLLFEETSQLLYLHGGWDGTRELGDLWTYSLVDSVWKCICQDSSQSGGPSPRSCHRISLDKNTRTLYFLGQYVEISQDNSAPLSDFYCYQIDSDSWKKLSSDTASEGGPQAIFNHQMCYSTSTQSLYVFGGRVLSPNYLGEGTYSGLYVYHVARGEWACLQPDFHHSSSYVHSLLPRMDHAMVLSQSQNLLYILGGERSNQALDDMLTYNILSAETSSLADGKDKHIPESDLTIQTCFDDSRQEILLLANLGRFYDTSSFVHRKSCSPLPTWLYSVHTDKWLSVKQQGAGPCPRFAHQVAYDSTSKTYFMFGGHPGDSGKGHQSNMRLDDLWTMKLIRQDRGYLVRQCQLLIRQQRFSELSATDPSQAVHYLQNDVSEVVEHDNPKERKQFQKMAAQLFSSTDKPNTDSVNLQRNEVYSKLCSMFPSNMTQPSQNISDLVDIVPH